MSNRYNVDSSGLNAYCKHLSVRIINIHCIGNVVLNRKALHNYMHFPILGVAQNSTDQTLEISRESFQLEVHSSANHFKPFMPFEGSAQ